MTYSQIGCGLLHDIAPSMNDVSKCLIIHPRSLAATAEALQEELRASKIEALVAEVPDGEESKRIEVAAFCWQIMGQADFHRNDAVIGLGGGATTD